MWAKCYLCSNEVDEFAIIETNPEIAVCFDCYEKTITKEVRKKLNKESNRYNFITKLIQEAKEREQLQQIFEGGETHGNKR